MIDTWLVLALVVVAVGAAVVAWRVQRAFVRKRADRIEAYLRLQKAEGPDEGRCSVPHLMAQLRMTRGQVLDACRHSPAIMRLASTASFPGAIFSDAPIFEYAPLRGRF